MVSRKILRMAPYNHIAALVSLIIGIILTLIVLIIVQFDTNFVIALGGLLGIDTIATLYLHVEYWLKNKGESYQVGSNGLTRKKSNHEKTYGSSEIDRIEIYMTPAMYKRSNFQILGIEAYHYAKVFLKTGEELIITCLLEPKLDKAFKGLRNVPIERKKRLFNSLR